MKVAVVGVGGVGGYFGGRLATLDDVEVVFLLRESSSNLAVLRDNERVLTCKSDLIDDFIVSNPRVATRAEDVGPCDFVLVCVKTYDLRELAPTLRPLVSSERDTAVVPLLNGMDAPRVLADALGEEFVVGGLCRVVSYLEAPGVVRHVSEPTPPITFGETTPSRSPNPRLTRLRSAFSRAGVSAHVPMGNDGGGVTTRMWDKFVKIVALSGAQTVCRAGIGDVLDEPRSRGVLERSVAEGRAVAVAHGVDPARVDSGIDFARRLPRDSTTSMQRDVLAGRVSELHEQLGTMVRLAEEKGVPVPTIETMYAALLPQENAARISRQKPRNGDGTTKKGVSSSTLES